MANDDREKTVSVYEETRRFERYRAREPLYAALSTVRGQLCEVRDISRGGLGIECTHLDPSAYNPAEDEVAQISLFVPGTLLHIADIPFELVHETAVEHPTRDKENETALRIGLRFGALSREQAIFLEKLLSEHCIFDES